MRTLNNRQTRIIALCLLIAAIASAGVIARSFLIPDSTFIISGEEKPKPELTISTGESGGSDASSSESGNPLILTGTRSAGSSGTISVQAPDTGQLQSPQIGTVTQPVTDNTGGMGGGIPQTPDTPDTDCGCVDKAIDRSTGTLNDLAAVPGF